MNKKIVIGSRSSKLALIYAQTAKDKIIQNTNLQSEDISIKKINTNDELKLLRDHKSLEHQFVYKQLVNYLLS